MRNGYWIIRTYRAGAVGEKTKYWIDAAPGSRSKRKEKQSIRKQEQNGYHATRTAARLINENFGPGAWLIGLDYSDEAIEKLIVSLGPAYEAADGEERRELLYKAAEREMRLLIRRVRREMAKDGEPPRYLGFTSDMDGATGADERIHHHIIVSDGAREVIAEKWEHGGVDWEPLREQEDYTALAEYLMRQVRHMPDAKKYIPSRNLVRAEPTDRVAVSDAELRVPRGGTLLHRSEYKPGRPQYIRYVLPEERAEITLRGTVLEQKRRRDGAARPEAKGGTP